MKIAPTLMSLIALIVATSLAAAQEAPFSDLHGREPAVADLAPRGRSVADAASSPGVRLGLVVSTVQRAERRDYAGSLMLSIPTDFLVSPRKAKDISAADEISTDQTEEDGGEPRPPPDMDWAPPRSDGTYLPLIRPRDARAAIAAAQRAAGFARVGAELDSMGSRARWSAVLPQVRLRATRQIDESTSLSPTSYDADRTTAKGGASLWLEGRATWDLDRLVFASEEVRIARVHQQLRVQMQRRSQDVLTALFSWQRAAYAMHDPTAGPQSCLTAYLSEGQLAAELDVLTAGWFSRWHKQRLWPDAACLAPFQEEAARRSSSGAARRSRRSSQSSDR